MTPDDAAILRRLLVQLEDEAARLDAEAEPLKDLNNGFRCVALMGRSTGIVTATSAIRCALPQLAKET